MSQNSPSRHPSLQNYEILVADDSEENRFLLERLLARHGANVSLAYDGEEAVEIARCKRFDLVLMDIQMPNMDGHTAARRLMGLGYSHPIVALTAASSPKDIDQINSTGFSGHVSKPVNKDILLELVMKIVKENSPNDPTELA